MKSSVKRYGMAQRGIACEHLYAHFHDKVHRGIEDMQAMIMNKTTLNELIWREGFWTYKLNTFVAKGLSFIEVSFQEKKSI